MTREIKFRAWMDDGRMICGEPDYIWEMKSDDSPVMQYTGLKDKNGKEIYEGDIITYQEEPQKMKAEVVWKNGGFVFVYEDGTENITSESWYAPMDVEITEIIGNVHENPDLIKSIN